MSFAEIKARVEALRARKSTPGPWNAWDVPLAAALEAVADRAELVKMVEELVAALEGCRDYFENNSEAASITLDDRITAALAKVQS